jgi:hypothetical protein
MDIEAYFAQGHTPSERSPVGALMVRVLAKNPGMGFERARHEANAMTQTQTAAGRRLFRIPVVYSPEEQAANRAKMVAAFSRSSVQIAA